MDLKFELFLSSWSLPCGLGHEAGYTPDRCQSIAGQMHGHVLTHTLPVNLTCMFLDQVWGKHANFMFTDLRQELNPYPEMQGGSAIH